MFRSWVQFFRGDLKVGEGFGPHLVEMGAQARYTLGIELIEAARSGAVVEHEAGVFQHFEVLRDGGTADGESARELVHGQRSSRQLLEDSHAGGVAEGVESGLEVSVHIR
jgi:hypothetical protein